ncbi:PilZ domain-containing protein [Shewanella sp. VB17]|uniref:PilZ domain-containing protein n=1 Tax=Shewanella sp. VB17 TaxID=2739432 RepID=UPI0015638738|nr:PilZ domain-containing protein [Shewanella sp. VB17]NRD74626.1 PilZ domain-containing protein [Shewanella sp. VB17]
MTENDERRSSLRVDMQANKIEIAWLDESQSHQSTEATCIDLARHGILFEHTDNFTVSSLIDITFNPDNDKRHTVKGQICRSNNVGNMFHIAVQLININ